jgi:hypothetical protein
MKNLSTNKPIEQVKLLIVRNFLDCICKSKQLDIKMDGLFGSETVKAALVIIKPTITYLVLSA